MPTHSSGPSKGDMNGEAHWHEHGKREMVVVCEKIRMWCSLRPDARLLEGRKEVHSGSFRTNTLIRTRICTQYYYGRTAKNCYLPAASFFGVDPASQNFSLGAWCEAQIYSLKSSAIDASIYNIHQGLLVNASANALTAYRRISTCSPGQGEFVLT